MHLMIGPGGWVPVSRHQDGAPLSPDGDRARRLLDQELLRSAYHDPWPQRLRDWLLDHIFGAAGDRTLGIPTGLLSLLLVLLVVGVIALVAFRMRGRPANRAASAAVFDGEVRRTSAEHRRLAQTAQADGRWDLAVIEAMRALAAGLVERGVIDDLPAATAHEVILQAQPRFPHHADGLEEAGRIFDETRYGDRAATRAWATQLLDLEGAIRDTRPVTRSGGSGPVVAVPR